MNLMFRLFSTAVLVAACAAAARAQVPGGRDGSLATPPRDTHQRLMRTGTVSGRVVSADTGAPLRRAQITIKSADGEFTRSVITGTDGRYELADLPPGRYRLSVRREGYVTLEYGQIRPFEAGNPVDVAPGQVLEHLDFSLPRGGAITGRITDELGDPITDVEVQALRYQFASGERELVTVGRTAQTDDLGAYRIFGLMPGDYLVRALPRDIPIGRASDAEQVAYPATYYPGVIDVRQAQVVTVTLAQELGAVAFPLVLARLSRVSGTVISSDGRPLVGAILRMTARGGAEMNVAGINAANEGDNVVRADGSFLLKDVPPGDYVLDIRQRMIVGMPEVSPSQLELASVPISVSGDIDNLSVVTAIAATVSGRVVYGSKSPPAPDLRVSAVSPEGAPASLEDPDFVPGRVDSDGTFELPRVTGPRIIRVEGLPPGWAVKHIAMEGMDITDAPFDFRPGINTTGLVITLTDQLSEFSGTVRNARGEPVTDYVLVAFSADAKFWGAQSRHVQTTRPNQNGTFSIKGLPPGRYLAAVVPALEDGLHNDPTVLEQLRPRAQSFELANGQVLNVDLRLSAQ